MAKFGRYKLVSKGRYRDLDTGRFLATKEVERLNRVARAYGSLAKAPGEGLLAAAESISERHGIAYDEVLERLQKWRRDVADALARGEDAPAIPSP